MAASMIANMPEKTGKSLQQWLAVAKKTGGAKHGEIVKALKTDHGLTDLVASQYSGAKAGLRPIYDAVIKAVSALGKDVEVAPKKSYVSLRRNKQFALVQPSTKTRVDLGINLKGEAATGKLEESGSFNAMVSHRVRLEKPADVDKQVKTWLKKAYSAA